MLNKQNKILLIITALLAMQVTSAEVVVQKGAQIYGGAVHPAIVNIDMNTIKHTKKWQPGDPIKEIPMINRRAKDNPFQTTSERGFGKDPLATKQELSQNNFAVSAFSNTLVNVDGSSYTGVNPSDTNGDVGINYYIQSINAGSSSNIFIINKTDGTLVSEFLLNSLAAGSGTGCGAGTGDPVIFYDQFAENGTGNANGRWVLTEFTNTSFCVYVSQTSDPMAGSWYIYEFNSSTGDLPDYPKFGNWSDAYYIGANEGPRQYALDKQNMLIGATARPAQFFVGTELPGFGFQHIMPVDADGETLPPTGAPGIFMRHRDGDYHDNGTLPDVLEMFEFHVDWNTPANSTFTGPFSIEVSEFDTNLGGTNFDDLSVTQPSGTNLFPLKQPLMWRVQHRTIDGKQYIVGNMVTDVDGNDLHGVRWFQLERLASTITEGWTLADEGTYSLGDNVNRWMASTAMDGDGNIAIGYNVSNTSTYPGMRYAGRLTTDTPGTMPRGEHTIIEGTASNSSGRWGDYSSLSVDPVDECTFWYTAQYNVSSNWSTRIASFKFNQCGCQLTLDTVNLTNVTANADNSIELSWNDSNVPEMIEYHVYRSTTAGEGYIKIATINDTSIGTGASGTYSYTDTTVSAGTQYYYIIRASDGGSCLTQSSNELSDTATGVCTLSPTFEGISTVTNDAQDQCSLSINWNAAASRCPNGTGAIDYSVYRSTDPIFNPDTSNRINTLNNLISYQDQDASLNSQNDYYYIVRAADVDNNLNDTNLLRIKTKATGPLTLIAFNENLENYPSIADAQIHGWNLITNNGVNDWRIESGDGNTGSTTSAFIASDVQDISDKSIATKAFVPSPTSQLSFYHKYLFEDSYDGGVLEITTDGGSTWQDLGFYITTGGYNITLDGGYSQPLGAVPAWGNDLTSYTLVQVDLSNFAYKTVQVRWRMGTDSSQSDGDWKVDDIVVTNSGLLSGCNIVDLIYTNGFEVTP